ncbi:MAG: saccharopine dehydrogenase NADP-binding domain-containing protein [Saprospiraceae bacterium]|nr:saccharopine dehydrogenase NADP-binding domain-containing protein [Saprospiraceae bacterium]
MKNILVLGAGRSATSLIQYLLSNAIECDWKVIVADLDLQLAQNKIGLSDRGEAVSFHMDDQMARNSLISQADVVISMLPPHLHVLVAEDCLTYSAHLLTASYLNAEMKLMNVRAHEANLLFMNEMGLDPGIDHMSAMQMIAGIEKTGNQITGFRSYTGGLISPEDDDNPWHYKITWNPRNVVLAGQTTARFRSQGLIKYLPYQQLFRNAELIEVPGVGDFEMYPNRDSLPYADIYGLQKVKTLIRGTLRHVGFCRGWAALVSLGLTDDQVIIDGGMFDTYRALLKAFLPGGDRPITEQLADRLGVNSLEIDSRIMWLFDSSPLPSKKATMAEFLQDLLIEKLALKTIDKDMVVMHHVIEYSNSDGDWSQSSSMVQRGVSSVDTAMAKLVGLPLAICTKLLLQDQISIRGVCIPIHPEVYNPVLRELSQMGVRFSEQTIRL